MEHLLCNSIHSNICQALLCSRNVPDATVGGPRGRSLSATPSMPPVGVWVVQTGLLAFVEADGDTGTRLHPHTAVLGLSCP